MHVYGSIFPALQYRRSAQLVRSLHYLLVRHYDSTAFTGAEHMRGSIMRQEGQRATTRQRVTTRVGMHVAVVLCG